MKLHKSLVLFGATALILAGCADDGAETEETAVEEPETEEVAEVETEETEETDESTEVEETNDDFYEFNEVVVENENYKITLLNIEREHDEMWDEEKIKVRYDVENLSDIDIEVQARTVSLNDRMVDESLLMMSQEVAAGKSADATLEIQDYEGNELPALEGNFEMTLHIFDWDFTFEDDIPVSVNLD